MGGRRSNALVGVGLWQQHLLGLTGMSKAHRIHGTAAGRGEWYSLPQLHAGVGKMKPSMS